MTLSAHSTYSAKVRLELRIGTVSYPLAQIADDRLIFSRPVTLPGAEGDVHAFIDDHEQRWIATWQPSDAPRIVIPVTLHKTPFS